MSNIYKLQRFTGDAWVDVKIGQEIPTTVTNTSDQTEVVAQLEEYLTLSQISGQFLSTQLLAGNLSSHALYQMPNARAIGNTSVAFGSSVTRGINSVAFGGSGTSSLPIMSSGLYWDGTQFYAPAIPDSLEVLQRGMLKIVTGSFGTFYLVIDTINFDSTSEKYIFTFSQTLGDWSSFINIVDGITDTNKHITATVHCLTHSAAGNYSLISGVNCQTTSEASYAHAFGQGLIANSPAQTVIGSYNQENSDAKFIIGGGTSNSIRTNLLEVYSNGVRINSPTITLYYSRSQEDEYSLSIPDYENWRNQFEEVRIYWGHRQFISNARPYENPVYNYTGAITTMHLPEYDSNYTINGSCSSGLTTNRAGSIMVLEIKNGRLSATVDGERESFYWNSPPPAPYFVLEFIKPRN